MGILDDAKPLEEVPKHLGIMLFGPPGGGKTIALARTANKTLLISDEKAYVSISQFPEIAATVDVIPLKSFDYLNGVVTELYQGNHDYDHFMIDTVDGLVRQKLREQLRKIKFERAFPDLASIQDYGLLVAHMAPLVVKLAALPISVSYTSHERFPDPKNYGKGDRLLRPNVPFQAFNILNGYVNVVGYMESVTKGRETRRSVTVSGTDSFTAKNHLKLSGKLTDDDFVDTIRKWKGYNV